MTPQQKASLPRIPIDRCHLYGIRSPHALAKRLGWNLNKLDKLAAEGGYRVFKHPATGRVIQEPSAALQSLHRQLHRNLARIEVPVYLHSAVKGRSYLSNAKAHVGAGGLVKIDIAKFYQSVPQHKVMHFFRDVLRCAPDVAGLLANIICYKGALPTGSAVSPIISYFAFKPLFDGLKDLADQNCLVMTCYVDDVTFSGVGATAAVLHQARTMIFRAGLRAHKDKVFPAGEGKIVTGVAVGHQGISLPFSRWRKINLAVRELNATDAVADRLKLYPKLVSRLYEATQIDASCRARAEFHHAQWRALKHAPAAAVTSGSMPVAAAA